MAVRPNHFLPYWQLAQLGTTDAEVLLTRAIRLNPYNAGPLTDLANLLEQQRHFGRAEEALLEANRVDKTYFPRWTLANFYLRRGRDADFWQWARRAAEVGSEDMTALFDLCRRLEPDPDRLAARLIPDRGPAIHNFLDYLARRGLPPPAGVCERALLHSDPNLAARLAIAVEGQLAARRFDDARRTWLAMVKSGVAAEPGEVPVVRSGMAFDWRLPATDGAVALLTTGGLEIQLTGQQAGTAVLCERLLLLDPSASYTVSHQTRFDGTGAGIYWKVILEGAAAVHTSDLTRPPAEPLRFRTGPGDRLARLVLTAERPLGELRARGTLTVQSVSIQRQNP